jgi:predicted Zn-dependent protease
MLGVGTNCSAFLLGEVSKHVTAYTGLNVDTKALTGDADVEALKVAQSAVTSSVCVVVLRTSGLIRNTTNSADAVTMSGRIATVDTALLKSPGADDATLLKRLKAETLRGIGAALGLSCPFPICALYSSCTDYEQDRKSLSFCPPCQAAFEKQLSKMKQE